MQRIAHFIVRFHAAIFCVFVALACVCLVCMAYVHVNRDMTRYLPETFQMSQGKKIMTEEFGEAGVFNVMVKGAPTQDRDELADAFEKLDTITSVTYEEDDAEYNSGDYALYELNSNVNSYTSDADSIIYAVNGLCSSRGYECWIDNEGLDSAASGLGPVLVAAVFIAMIILFVLASSWIEPLLLLITILVAVSINMGTNLFFGEISETTNAIGAVLQMALSMDYLIMLLNRYRREHVDGVTPHLAMERSITGGIKTIASSSITTVVGLLCLVPLSFTIGRDLGIVLAKGVFLSLVCAFAVMPALVLWLEDLMDRTAKPTIHPQMRGLAAFSYKLRVPITLLLVVVFAAGFALRGYASINFITESKNPDRVEIENVFPLDSQLVILYEAGKDPQVAALLDRLESTDGVHHLNSYQTSIGEQKTAAQMAEDNGMETSLVDLMYTYKHSRGDYGSCTREELADYLRHGMASHLGSDYIDSAMQDKLDTFADLVEDELGNDSYTFEQAADALSGHASIRKDMIELIYLAHASSTDSDPSWTMSTEQLMDLLVDDAMNDPLFDKLLDSKTRDELTEARDTIQTARDMFRGTEHNRVILDVSYDPASSEMAGLVASLRSMLDAGGLQGSYYLVGEGPMVQEMTESFDGEFNFLSLITIAAILVIVLVTFRSLVIPVLLVAVIQSAFCWDMVFTALAGQSIFYIALFCVQAILMGATIDYAILYTENYREARAHCDIRDALAEAYRNSIRTISMSGSILVFVCFVMGIAVPGITGQICLVISSGAAVAVAMVLLMLPAALATLDRVIVKRKPEQQ